MKWIRIETVLAIHDVQLAEHGGWSGVNLDPLERALHRPKDKAHYGGNPPISELDRLIALPDFPFSAAQLQPPGAKNSRLIF
jgi:hypothetical protein